MSIPPAVSSDSFRLDPEPCNLCKVTLRDILEPRYPGWAPRYHSSYSELEKSAQDGCNFCRMIRHAIHVWSYGLQNGDSQMAKIETIRLKVQPQSRRPYEIVGQKPLCFRISTGQRETDLAGSPEINMRYSWNPRSIRERYQPMKVARNIDAAIPVIQRWIRDCKDRHGECGEHDHGPSRATFPTRLVDVGSRRQDGSWSDPKLHSSKMDQRENMTDQYLALSYRWGMDHHASCTTEDRLAGFQTGIPWEDIPKTIQDAISITRSLGKQYIWVDALCIIQSQEGNSHDWENEVSRVGAYYQNALLTLSVLDAVDCNEGIFQSAPGARPAFDFEISGSTLTTGLHSNAMKTYSLVPNFPDLPSLIDGSQLQKRGWVVQERLFSSRTVHLGKYFMSWECHEFRAPEWDDTPLPQAAHWSFLSKIRSWLGRSREEQLGREWRRFIEHYSSTSLTKETDRLPAIAAFANVLETQHSQDRSQPKPNYIAGLWQESLLESLAWHRVGYYVGYHPWEESPRGKIHESCRIPSWSWPSAKNRIAFCSLKFEHAVIEDLSQPEDGLPALRLRCAMLQNAFKVATGISSNNEHLFFDHHPDLDGNRVASEGNPKQYSLALLGVNFPNYIGLILEAVHADSLVFRRVGLFKVADGSGYKSWINLWKECIGQDKTKSMDSEAGGLQVSFSLI